MISPGFPDVSAARVRDAPPMTDRPLRRQGHFNDEWVHHAQEVLATGGFYAGGIDGDFGPLTDQAVRWFQAACGLEVDGIIGEQTWWAIDDAEKYVDVKAGDAVTPSAATVDPAAATPAYLQMTIYPDLSSGSVAYEALNAGGRSIQGWTDIIKVWDADARYLVDVDRTFDTTTLSPGEAYTSSAWAGDDLADGVYHLLVHLNRGGDGQQVRCAVRVDAGRFEHYYDVI
jgi:peptidoglycan hydrolase-like protein with peptidoglycan-binding domain